MSNSSTLNWQQEIIKVDPNWQKDRLQPVVYEFTGRTFKDKPDPYSTP